MSTFSPLTYVALLLAGWSFLIGGLCFVLFSPFSGISRLGLLFVAFSGGVGVINIARRYRADREAEDRMSRVVARQLGAHGSGGPGGYKPASNSGIGWVVAVVAALAIGAWGFAGADEPAAERDCDVLVASMYTASWEADSQRPGHHINTTVSLAGRVLSDPDIGALGDEYETLRVEKMEERVGADEAMQALAERVSASCPEATLSITTEGHRWAAGVLALKE